MAMMDKDSAQGGGSAKWNWLILTAILPERAVKNIKRHQMKGSLSVVWFIAPHFHLIAG